MTIIFAKKSNDQIRSLRKHAFSNSFNSSKLIFALCVCLVSATMNVSAAESNLEPIENTAFNTLLVANDFKLPLSRKIYISEAPLSFSSTWQSEFGNLNAYQERISKKYGRNLVDKLKEALIASGWEIMDSPGADTIRLTPRLFDVYIAAPASKSTKVVIVTNYGRANIELIFATPDNQPFMKIVDSGVAQSKSGAEANRASNFRYFNKLMVNWSKGATAYLGYLMSVAEKKK